jgi:hypothetical protein
VVEGVSVVVALGGAMMMGGSGCWDCIYTEWVGRRYELEILKQVYGNRGQMVNRQEKLVSGEAKFNRRGIKYKKGVEGQEEPSGWGGDRICPLNKTERSGP